MSLLEACLSVAVITTSSMIAIPKVIHVRQNYVLNAAARDVATKMHLARINAVARNRDCRLRTTSAASYVVECAVPVWAVIESVVLPRGITIAGTSPEFHRRGNVVPAGTMTLSNQAGLQKRVIVNNIGRIRVQ